MKRIDSTSRAPEILAEIKRALGTDPARFARAVARPIVVDCELHAHFDNDSKVHGPQRREAEQTRAKLLKEAGGSRFARSDVAAGAPARKRSA